MDTRQLEYIVAIAEEKSLLRAAERLFVSSSALSQALYKMEQSLGAPLFVRSKTGLKLTDIGKLYLDMAYSILGIERKTLRIIQQSVNKDQEHFTIGVTTGRGTSMFSAVFPLFNKEFPNTRIRLCDGTGPDILALLNNGKIDLGILPGNGVGDNLDHQLLIRETMMLVVPRKHILSSSGIPEENTFSTVSLSLFKSEEFLLLYENAYVRNLTDEMCWNAGFKPKASFEASSMATIDNLSRHGFGIAFVQEYFADPDNPDAVYFYTDPPGYSDLCAAYRKGYVLSPSQRRFIELARDFFLHRI